ncbi:hypothetical protein KKJFFJLC_00039 [Vibrio phage vB_VpaS_PGB]|nr:hypothetical protein HHKILHMN_00058 [Vibrio phage vB_VpaS_PGA]WVH05582.1 hypothetical protein KKJFFJLC_00039 [Vibrio phage vB_VpaS_PGB]
MKTEMKTAYIYAAKWCFGFSSDKAELEVSFDELHSSKDRIRHLISEVKVPVPTLSQDDLEKILNGAEIEALQKQKEDLQAKTFAALSQLDQRIGELQALEFKGDSNE